MVCTCIADACKANGWNYEENVKTSKWKADVVVEYGNYKVAFNVCKRPCKVEEKYQVMREERVCGCWLLLPTNHTPSIDRKLPCFYIKENADGVSVCFDAPFYWEKSSIIKLSDFAKSIVEGHVRWADKMNVRYIEVCFFNYRCWKCGTNNHVYFISRVFSDDGISVNFFNWCGDTNIAFHPFVVKAINDHIANHPELGIMLGAVKPRYSKTVDDTYMSFGCCKCDSIFGDFFIQDAIMDYCYEIDSLQKIRIDVGAANLIIPAQCWYIR